LGESGGRNLRFWFRDPQKALPWAEPRRLTYFASKSVRASRLYPFSITKKIAESLCAEGWKSRMRRTETPKPIRIKFCVVVDITDLVTYTNFGGHQLRGYWGAGSNFPPPIDFHRRPCITLALPQGSAFWGSRNQNLRLRRPFSGDFAHAQKRMRLLTEGRELFSQITLITFIVEPPKLHSE